ncbi:MAG TPA: DUF58 domain-containing protein, partial [Polyangiales bacterium]|nr:DUF58 domain-containing protein [Polyangiales bacterium]
AANADTTDVIKRASIAPSKSSDSRSIDSERPWRRHLRSTREGKAFIMVTIGVGLAAFNTGNNLLFLILGFMLSLIVLSGVMSETAIRGLRVTRRLPQRAFAGKVCLVELVLHNKKSRAPSYSLEIEDLAEDAPTERRCYFLKVGPGAEQAAAYRRTLTRRGPLRFVGFRVATRYPFGIFEKWRMLSSPADLLVYPALLADQDLRHDMKSHGLDSPTQRIGVGTEIAGLRSYETGDDARSIHWRRTASLGRLVVTERQSDASSQLTLLLDNAKSIATPELDAEFETMVSRAATLAVAGVAHGLSVEVIARGSRSPLLLGFTAPDPILRYLATIAPVDPNDAPRFGAYARNTRVILLNTKAVAT